ncbi:MAG: hypothetical protein K8M05_34110 [Deltaproteobacteria bacterium]|nr:hypothetical protein [Kofleriaceae bacterium]
MPAAPRSTPNVGARLAILVILAGTGAACDEPACPSAEAAVSAEAGAWCASVHELARRRTEGLVPSQAELDRVAEVLEAASRPLEPILVRVPAATPWEGPLTWIGGEVLDPTLAAAWRSGVVHTGVDAVDRVLDGAHIVRVRWTEDRFVELGSDHAIAADNVVDALAGVAGLSLSFGDRRATTNPEDVVDEGVDIVSGDHWVRFSIGWGGCDVACDGQYSWRTAVREDGSVRLLEEWGDPIPDDVRTAWYR